MNESLYMAHKKTPTQKHPHTKPCVFTAHGGVRAVNHPTSFSQSERHSNVPIEKPEEWPSCWAQKRKHSNRVKDSWIPGTIFKLSNDTFIHDRKHQLQSNAAKGIYSTALVVYSTSQHSHSQKHPRERRVVSREWVTAC